MDADPNRQRSIDVVEGTSGALVGAGIVTMALFPLALPIIALTAIALLPFLVVALALGLVAAVVAAPVLLVRRLRRSSGAARRREPEGLASSGRPRSDARLGRGGIAELG